VANIGSNSVSAFAINSNTGALTALGAPVPAGDLPSAVTVDPSGKLAYRANFNSNNLSTFAINAVTGALTAVGSPVTAGNRPVSLTVDPSGRFAYAASEFSNNVSAFAINADIEKFCPTTILPLVISAMEFTGHSLMDQLLNSAFVEVQCGGDLGDVNDRQFLLPRNKSLLDY